MRWLSSIKKNKPVIIGKTKTCIYETLRDLGLKNNLSIEYFVNVGLDFLQNGYWNIKTIHDNTAINVSFKAASPLSKLYIESSPSIDSINDKNFEEMIRLFKITFRHAKKCFIVTLFQLKTHLMPSDIRMLGKRGILVFLTAKITKLPKLPRNPVYYRLSYAFFRVWEKSNSPVFSLLHGSGSIIKATNLGYELSPEGNVWMKIFKQVQRFSKRFVIANVGPLILNVPGVTRVKGLFAFIPREVTCWRCGTTLSVVEELNPDTPLTNKLYPILKIASCEKCGLSTPYDYAWLSQYARELYKQVLPTL